MVAQFEQKHKTSIGIQYTIKFVELKAYKIEPKNKIYKQIIRWDKITIISNDKMLQIIYGI